MGELFTPTHMIVLAVVAIVLFGGKKLPELGKGLGEGLRGFKEGMKGINDEPNASTKPGETENTYYPDRNLSRILKAATGARLLRVLLRLISAVFAGLAANCPRDGIAPRQRLAFPVAVEPGLQNVGPYGGALSHEAEVPVPREA